MNEIRLHDVELVPERTLGSPADDAPLRGRLTFGWDLLPADHAGTPADWRSYLGATPGREFRQLLMVCSFRPETPESKGVFRHASLGVALTTPDRDVRPIARLIDPGERTRPVPGLGTGVSFTVTTGVLDVGVEKPPGSAPAKEEWIVRGHGASQPNPQWEFRRVKGFPLVGDHPVAALVELVPDRTNTAEVLVAAELEHRTWGIRRYRAQLAPTPHTIVLAE
ncbi:MULTISPECIES: hypothetical protein [Streptomyces]|uniref:Uncharacterized protein n=1 Tax=Streptomyces venezuelae (strain ATCC 10712 / CBS 650.69 / DSM 40230 / JCM 4526 / NBRC 13096 / PD 04745) TaxID=953739 RepID=F2RC86_STRVP|nr:hypothetical protein [Streptomyces venezuelae]APE24830.1 hypothetical protein vnz_29895 [Streptomyces venezuelae]QES02175.1 hypothetical protein DEJ43_30375 [Streptomyces venezuelae ATCC 10712]CCA59337.1 hypothetical protein SVEN_6051 [Streptomyces venezuelae ATCC 10712]